MRIQELADLTGVTVRTIRYYHQLGLLPVPGVRYSYRDYGLSHVARVTRVRWLTQAGIPLSAIGGILDEDRDQRVVEGGASANVPSRSVLADLHAAMLALDEHLAEIARQKDRLRRLIASVERGDPLSPMPPSMAKFYDAMELRSGDERVRRQIRRERDFNELAFYRGDMPAEAELLFQGFEEADLLESLALYGVLAEREAAPHAPSEEEINAFAASTVGRIVRQLGDDLPRLARAVDADAVRRAVDLYVSTRSEEERRLARVVGDAIVAMLEEARAT